VSWRDDAACQDVDLEDLFGIWEVQAEIAKKVCVSCPVREECWEAGKHEVYGLWGGIPEGSKGRRRGGHKKPRQPRPKTCEVASCDREPWAKRLCNAHYTRLRNWGDVKAHVPIFRSDTATVDVDTVLEEVAAETGVDVVVMVGPSIRHEVVAARQEAMARLREGGWPYQAIGRVFNRDHSTAVHAYKRVRDAA
jgi:hypothetical protein